MLQNYQLIIKKLELAETTLKSTRYGKNTYIYAICSADVCRALSTEHLHKTKSKRKKKKEKKEKSKDAQQQQEKVTAGYTAGSKIVGSLILKKKFKG